MTTNWGRVEAAFDQALGLNGAHARSVFLAALAADEPAVAAEVRALLTAETAAGRFLGRIGEQAQGLQAFTLQPGQRLGRYRIEACLAAGGMGVVYRARDEQLQRPVALKFLAAHAADDPDQRQRLLAEARWASRLDHPNVCTVHEIGETDGGQVFIVMALCPGEDLGRRLRRGAMTVERIVRLSLQLTEALTAAHAAGVLHRDLKPGNVIVDDDGTARLVDFGIAAATRRAGGEPVPAGTLAYMAPEQIDGRTLDERCDVWGVGAVLFEALTGRRPFPRRDGIPPASLRRLDHAAPPPGSLVAGVPPGLDALVLRCLHPDPDHRFADAKALATALRALLQQSAADALAAAPAASRGEKELVLGSADSDEGAPRYLTVLSVDAGPDGTTEPEAVLEAVTRFGGQCVDNDGDGVLAVFGYPVADEFAALRGARCAAIIADTGDVLQAAVATGPGWLQLPSGEGPVRIGGEVFERARRLHGEGGRRLALDAATARLADGHLDQCGALPRQHRPVHPTAAARRHTPLIGRVHELGLLHDAWERCLEHEQQVILIGGEPGIGKTRLIQELIGAIGNAEQPLVAECPGSPHQMASPLHPVVSYLRAQVLGESTDPARAARRLRALLVRHGLGDPTYLLALGRLLGLPDPAEPVMLSPELEKERTLTGLLGLLTARARQQPCLLVFEDLHWADPTTLELLERLWQNTTSASLLVVCTHRPEFRPPWSTAPGVTHMRLPRLRHSESRAMAEAVAAGRELDEADVQGLLARCDGIPLFIEELGADLVSGHAPTAAIPWTLHDSLLGRLERLGEARRVAQAAAVAGRSVEADVLERIAGVPRSSLDTALAALQRAGLLLAEPGAPGPGYRFKHALIRDAAYESLAVGERRELHRRIADTLVEHFAERAARASEVLAQHYDAAGDPAAAAEHWARAAAKALARFAVAEAEDNARRGLESVAQMAPGPARQQAELGLCMTLGPALMAARGYADDAVNTVYSRARAMCAGLGDPPAVFPVLFGLWTFHCVRAQHAEALKLAAALVALAEGDGDAERLVEARMVRGITHYFMGRFRDAEADLAAAWDACSGQDLHAHTLRYGQDPAMVIRSYQSWNAWQLGAREAADAYSAEAVELARRSRHPFSIAYGLTFAAWHAMNRADPAHARVLLAEAIELCREHRIQVFLALAMALDALRRIAAGEASDGLAAMEESLQVYTATGAGLFLPAWYGAMAQAHAAQGDTARAGALLEEAQGRCERTGERWCLAEIYRGRAVLAEASGAVGQARHWLEEGRALAQSQGASAWLARIEASMPEEKGR